MELRSKTKVELLDEYKPHDKAAVNSILFFPPNIIISASDDSKVCIYDISIKRVVSTISLPGAGFYLLKFSSDSFFVSSNDIRGYELNNDYSYEKIFNIIIHPDSSKDTCNRVQNLLKLDESKIMAYVCRRYSPLIVVDINKKKVIQEIDCLSKGLSNRFSGNDHNLYIFPRGLILSKKNPKCIFVTTGGYYGAITDMINYEKNSRIKTFSSTSHAYGMESYIHRKLNTEILIAGVYNENFYFFDTDSSSSSFSSSSSSGSFIYDRYADKDMVFKIKAFDEPYSFKLVEEKYLVVGQRDGYFQIFQFNVDKNENRDILSCLSQADSDTSSETMWSKSPFTYGNPPIILGTRNLRGRSTILDLEIMELKKNKMVICSCSEDGFVRISSIQSDIFDFAEKFENLDVFERIEYLIQNYCDEFEMKFGDTVFFNVNRVFFLL